MTHARRVVALKWASGIVIAFGMACSMAVFTPVAAVMEVFLGLATLSAGEGNLLGAVEGRLVTAILGGITAGWGVMIWLVTTHVYANDPVLGGRLIVMPTLVWFAVDSIGSVMSGAAFNGVLNLSFLAILVLPVIWPGQVREAAS